ncbi:AI-2E family transporter [bacterium]|nr:AI-2E family transporter [bacterium]
MTSDRSLSLKYLSYSSVIVLAVIAGTAALSIAKNVLVPLVFALFIYSLMSPAIDYMMNRWRLKRGFALGLAGLVYLIVGFVGVSLSVSSIQNFSVQLESYQERFKIVGVEVQQFADSMGFSLLQTDWLEQIGGARILNMGRLLTGNILDWVGFWALVSVYLFFLFSGKSHSQRAPDLIVKIQNGITKYAWVKSIVSILTATLVGIVLISVGSDLVFLFALLALILNFIPNLGSIIATFLPLPILWLQFGFGSRFFVALGLMVGIQIVVGNILEPKLMGRSLNLHPVTIMFFLIFWGFVWGISGAFLSVPLTVILHLVLSRIPVTKPIADLMSGKLSSS